MGINMQKMMKQVQKMQQDVARVQEELANRNVEGSAGGGAVKAVFTCAKEPVEFKIDPSAVDPEDVEMLEEMILAATKEALRAAEDIAQKEMSKVTGGVGLPGMGF
ncbi:MAG TPA: YbaB/EbfC family nucleoid-associated protein [Bacillota bacterium]|nr:YbaB/EbfC family nucleoid-associated protein [Bacillota bacterium]HOH10075.1 YbaB/EbfC family nucleoid-associated protein [Bacillota bacterium]HOS50142.1 YbaB/EbfC family nucleoid-associated protein [Bacillota bacterium]HPI01427.1 YbaB/EbfC family nucleoid-associated protein [Bacillota bacterium]HPM63218.1 YbaB/EbfC family nucleoid-associated protein [Bacillota bacterium]